MAEQHKLIIRDEMDGLRLDRALADLLADVSRSRLQALLTDGCVREESGGTTTVGKRKVIAGECYVVTLPDPIPAEPVPQDIPLDVVFEDDHLIIIDKPRGLVVHPAAGNADGTLVNALLHHCRGSLSGIGGVARPGIVHRLDKDTSGLMVAAKTDAAHQGLAAQFKDHTIQRAYQALVWGYPLPGKGTIEGNIGRDPRNRKRMAIVPKGGKQAVTHFETQEAFGQDAARVICRLETGRTHQIRVHMTSIGHPLVGDPLYGSARKVGQRRGAEQFSRLLSEKAQVLHAYMLGFMHPITGEEVSRESKIPLYFSDLLKFLKRD